MQTNSKIWCSYEEDEDLDYQEDYEDYMDDEDSGDSFYQGYDDDDYQNPDSEYEDE